MYVCVSVYMKGIHPHIYTPMYANAQGGPSRQQSGGSHRLLLGRHQSVHTQTHGHQCTQTQIGMYTNTKHIHSLLNGLLLPPHTCKRPEMYSCIHKCSEVLTGVSYTVPCVQAKDVQCKPRPGENNSIGLFHSKIKFWPPKTF